MTIRGRSKLVD